MKLENVLVEDVTLKDGEAVLNSKLYEFAGPRWISLHSGKEGQALGPVTLLKDKQPSGSEPEIVPRSFGERPLKKQAGKKPVVSYSDKWTFAPWTLYALTVPVHYYLSVFKMTTEGHSWEPAGVGATSDNRLFYYDVFEGFGEKDQKVVQIEARIEQSVDKYLHQLESADTVKGTSQIQELRNAVQPVLVSPDFWSKMIELGTNLIKGG